MSPGMGAVDRHILVTSAYTDPVMLFPVSYLLFSLVAEPKRNSIEQNKENIGK
jgi:hypothetical protein